MLSSNRGLAPHSGHGAALRSRLPMIKTAFTLVEVLVSLILLSVFLMLVGFAIDVNMRFLDATRSEVEETQLARALLEKISRDIRSVVVAKAEENLEIDSSIFDSMFEDSLGMGMDELTAATSDSSSASSSTSSDSSGSSSSDYSTSELPEEGTVVGTMPGIYGSLDWIQIDTGRLPRGETFRTETVTSEGTSLMDHVSPTKTVLYYLGDDTGTLSTEESTIEKVSGSLGEPLNRYSILYGLYRRQLDRNVCKYAEDNGLESEYETHDESLAPEVEAIVFEYYDINEEEWIDYWDMDEFGTLPAAIRVIIYIRKKHIPKSAFSFRSDRQSLEMLTFSTVIPMPLSYEAPQEEEEEETASATN